MLSGTNDLVQKEERVFNAPAWGAAGFIKVGFAGNRSMYHPVIKVSTLILSFSSF